MMGNEIENKWWNGPSWLAQDKDKWPKREFVYSNVCPDENKKIQIVTTKMDSDQNFELSGVLVFQN